MDNLVENLSKNPMAFVIIVLVIIEVPGKYNDIIVVSKKLIDTLLQMKVQIYY